MKIKILLFFIIISIQNNNEWKLRKSADGISVFTKLAAGSAYEDIKANTTIKTSLSSLVAVIKDIPSYTSWAYECKKVELTKIVNGTEIEHYQETAAPWPVSNRDIVVHTKITQDKNTKIIFISLKGIPDGLPRNTDLIRVTKFEASWKFIPKENNMVEIEYNLSTDPAGSIPAWVANMAMVEGPFQTLKKLKEIVNQPKYQNAKYSFIEEK